MSLRLRSFGAATLLLAAGGCSAVVTPGVTTYPVDAPVDYAQLPRMRHGEACSITYFFLFGPNGAASIAAAAREAGLHRVRYVDNRYENQFWRQRYCVVAYGE